MKNSLTIKVSECHEKAGMCGRFKDKMNKFRTVPLKSPGNTGKKALAISGRVQYNEWRKEGKEIKNMKVQNIKDVNKFFEVVDSCAGKVELVTGEGDRLNLKSKLCQYVSLANIFSNGEIPELEIIAYEKEDIDKLLSFMING